MPDAVLRSMLRAKRAVDAAIGRLAVWLLKSARCTNVDFRAAVIGRFLRTVGPLLAEHRIGRANLKAAFPEKSAAEIERMLAAVWDNLGRVIAEFPHMESIFEYNPARPGAGRITWTPEVDKIFNRIRADGKPALVFAAHLANWELPALAAKAYGLDVATLFRRPNLSAFADAIIELRAASMGTLIRSGPSAPFKLADVLQRGAHVAMLVDQHRERGVDVIFFERRCKANPMLARLARHYDCPIHGSRAFRLSGDRYRIDLTEAIEVPRDADGCVNIEGTMQAVTSVVEAWVREYPEQWLWLHRRWR
jgi:Kdo2-lipid IVA lauroyltransferase/acyltransferase